MTRCIPPPAPPLVPFLQPLAPAPVPERWVEYDDEEKAPDTERTHAPDTLRCPEPPMSIPCESCGRPLTSRRP